MAKDLMIYAFVLVNAANDEKLKDAKNTTIDMSKTTAGKKGRTWGPSSIHQRDRDRRREKNRSRIYSDNNGRASSFPNLGVLDRGLIDSSSTGDLCKYILQLPSRLLVLKHSLF